MKYVKIAGIVWGLIYFAMGALKSFTLNSIDFWSSIALLFALFLLPLPIAFMALWFPRTAGKALFVCIAINVVAVASVAASHRAGIVIFAGFIALYSIPHIIFGTVYMIAGRASKHNGERLPSGGA